MPGRNSVAIERLRCRSTGLPWRERYRYLYRTCPSGCTRRSSGRFYPIRQRSIDQSGMGTYGRRYGQYLSVSQLDVAVSFSGRRRCPFVHSRKSIERFLLCAANQCSYRKRFSVYDTKIPQWRESNFSGHSDCFCRW